MEKTYYYLVASLPMLGFGTKPPVPHDHFLEDCQRVLPQTDSDIVLASKLKTTITTTEKNDTLNKWNQFNNDFSNEIAKFRAIKAGKDPLDYLRGEKNTEPSLAEAVIQASKSPDPLKAEEILDRIKWQYLDELSQGHYFDLDLLIIYSLKLQILERYKLIESPGGKEAFEDLRNSAIAVSV